MQYTNRKIFFEEEQTEEQIVRPKNLSLLLKKLSILCLTTFYFGYCLVYITALSDQTISDVFGTQFNEPWIKGLLVGCLTIGAMVGSMIAIPLVPQFSRRNLTLFICICAIILQGVIQAQYAAALFVCRSLQGVCSGIFLQLVPAYINDLSPKQIVGKGILGVMANVFVIVGVLTSFGFNILLIVAELNQNIRWRVIFAINFLSIFIVTVSIITGYIPESPNSLIEQKQVQKAKQVIGMFHKRRYVQEINIIKKLPRQQVRSPSLIRKVLAYQLPIMQQLTGINAFVSQMGGVASAYQVYFGTFVPVIMAVVHVMGALYSMTCLTRAKRKTMILTGNILMGICSLGIGILFVYINQFRAGFWIVVVLTFIYMTIHGATLIPGVWLYVGEIVNDNTPKYSSITNWFMCSVTIVVFPIINTNYGFAPMFLTFGVLTLLLAIFNSIFMFQTNDKVKNQKNFQLQ